MARRDRLIREAERQTFIVTTTDEETYSGILYDWDESHFVFADAEMIAANKDRLKIDGSLWLPRTRIKYMQAVRG